MDDIHKLLGIMFLNNPVKQWLVALVFITGGFIIGMIAAAISKKILEGFLKTPVSKENAAEAECDTVKNRIFTQIRLPLVFLFVLAGIFLGSEQLTFSHEFELWEDKILTCIFIILIFRIAAKLINTVIRRCVYALPVSPDSRAGEITERGNVALTQIELRKLIQNFVTIIMCMIPALLIVNTLGYNINTILAGLGIGGAAIALASKATLENVFGSISVFIDKPFHLNDRIKIIDSTDTIFDGRVIDMGLRISRIQTLDNRIITIPNSFFTRYPIQNVSSEPHTKIVEIINVRASNGYEKIKKAVLILKNVRPEGLKLGAPSIASLSTVNYGLYKITFVFFVAKDEDYWETINKVNLEIIRRFEEADISVSQDVIKPAGGNDIG